MKLSLIVILFFFIGIKIQAQTFEANYIVKYKKSIPNGEGKFTEFVLDYEGQLLQKSDSVISFLKPKYLLDYPNGRISIQTGENSKTGLVLDMDTMQRISLYNTKIEKYWSFNRNTYENFTVNSKQWPMKWKLMSDTMVINGLPCKRAVTFNGGDSTQILFDIWYYPDISMPFGLLHLKDAPGLVVECDFPVTKISYKLKDFKFNEPIKEGVFWPKVFNGVNFEDYTNPKKVSEKEKTKKEIMSGNN